MVKASSNIMVNRLTGCSFGFPKPFAMLDFDNADNAWGHLCCPKTRREKFVPPGLAEFSYNDAPLPIEEGQTISYPKL